MRRRIENLTERFRAFTRDRKRRKDQKQIQEWRESDRKTAEQLLKKLTPDVRAQLQTLGCYTTESTFELESGDIDTTVSLRIPLRQESKVMKILQDNKIFDAFYQNDLTVEALKITTKNKDVNLREEIEIFLRRNTENDKIEVEVVLFTGIINKELLNQIRISKVEQRPNI